MIACPSRKLHLAIESEIDDVSQKLFQWKCTIHGVNATVFLGRFITPGVNTTLFLGKCITPGVNRKLFLGKCIICGVSRKVFLGKCPFRLSPPESERSRRNTQALTKTTQSGARNLLLDPWPVPWPLASSVILRLRGVLPKAAA